MRAIHSDDVLARVGRTLPVDGHKEYMNVELKLPIGRETENFPVRELIDIKVVRWPIWRDVKL